MIAEFRKKLLDVSHRFITIRDYNPVTFIQIDFG